MKKQDKLIKIESSNGYLNLEDLPHNCIFNKVITGCGGTTIVINNSENYIIAVPTTELIVNKTGNTESGESAERNLFGLFGNFTNSVKSKLKNYLAKEGVKKIMCTYNKLPLLDEYLNPADFRILIDEYHTLLKSYSYRDKAIDGVLEEFKKYKSFCFMSATPIGADFKPSSLNAIPEYTAQWINNTERISVSLNKTNKPFVKAANIINAYKKDGYIELNGVKSYEAFFFINSVTDIKSILNYCHLNDSEVKIVCADTESNREKLQGYTISNSRSENKKFTFITSKSFEGADYFSETGICFVVSSSSNPKTLASIDTDIPQIAGRIRTKTNPFRNIIVHIFNTQLDNNTLSYEEMKDKTEKDIKAAKETVDYFNAAPKVIKDNLRERLMDKINNLYMYYDPSKDEFVLNDILPKLELYNFQLNKIIYSSGLQLAKTYNDNGYLKTKVNWELINDNMEIAEKSKKITFKDAYEEYSRLKKCLVYTEKEAELLKIYPFLADAYNKLGDERVRKLKYVQKAIKNELISGNDTKSLDFKVFSIIKNSISLNEFIPAKKAKELIKNAYNLVGIKDTAKGSDLIKWYDIDEASKRVDGKVIKGYTIRRNKIMFN